MYVVVENSSISTVSVHPFVHACPSKGPNNMVLWLSFSETKHDPGAALVHERKEKEKKIEKFLETLKSKKKLES